jgi:hypothetical protein
LLNPFPPIGRYPVPIATEHVGHVPAIRLHCDPGPLVSKADAGLLIVRSHSRQCGGLVALARVAR